MIAVSSMLCRTRTGAGVIVIAVIVLTLLCEAAARADFKSLAERIPDSANAVVAVNVEKVLNTPYAQSEWTPKTAESWAKQPMMVPPGSRRLLMASDVRTDTMEPFWEMCLMEMNQLPDLKAMAAADGGHIDRVWDIEAVCSPVNAYFVPLGQTTLASITPANRAAVTRWVRTAATRPSNIQSDYIRKVVGMLSDSTDIVMAMDLEGAFGVPQIRRFLDEHDFKQIKDSELDSVAQALGKMQGITLNITVGQDVSAKATVDFDGDVSLLRNSAKAIMLEVLDTAGMPIRDVEQWTVAASGKQVTMSGKLSTASLRNLLMIVSSPIPAATLASNTGAQQAASTDPAVASQRYYKTICGYLDNFKGSNSVSQGASWARATAKRIEQLPILNVDPELVQWGSMVSLKLKQVGAGFVTTQTQINARVSGIADPVYSSYSYDHEGVLHSAHKADMENVRRQRQQAALEQKAQAQQEAIRILSEIAETRPAVRASMVDKYKLEF